MGGMDFVRPLAPKRNQPPPPHPDAFVVTVRPLAAWVRLDVHSAIWTAAVPQRRTAVLPKENACDPAPCPTLLLRPALRSAQAPG